MKIKYLFIYILTVLLGTVIIDVACRFIFSPFFDNPPINTKAWATWKFVSYNKPANIVILGASRANHHYRSEQIEDSLGVSVFNYGWDGRCTLYQFLCLKKAIENGGLQIAILDLSNAQLSKEWVDERISDLYPYYWKNKDVREMVDEVERRDMRCFMASSLIQYNSQYLNLVAPISSIKGYTPLPYTGKAIEVTDIFDNNIEDNSDYYSIIAENYLEKMSSICKSEGVRLIVCFSPILAINKSSEKYLENKCKQYGIDYWNMSHFVNDPVLFSDLNHLNDKGAEIFTNEIIRCLKDIQ